MDVVTATDPAIERAVTAMLREAYPDHAVLGEETGGESGASGWLWIIDPIDGTRNFSRGIPLVFFNLALAYNGRPVLGLTADPLRDEVFYAEAGAGATLNGAPLRASNAPSVADAVLCLDLGLDDDQGRALLGALHDLFPGVQALRIVGTVALGLAYVAAGRLDAYLHPSAYAWDFAPGMLLVQEAGGIITQVDGSPLTLAGRSVLACAPAMHAELVARFRHIGT
jgi:fructose-1,6-bisphosphatase/inositol monophosphatase family enzyme